MDQLNSLIPALRSRNESAFGTVYQQTVDVFYRYLISSYGVSHQVAQDILSDVYIKLRNNVHSLQANSSLGAYLRTIVKNTAHDHFKKQKERSFSELSRPDSNSEFEDWLMDDHDMTLFLERNFQHDRIQKALSSLDQTYKDCIILKYVEQYTHHEISHYLGISEENVRQRLSRWLGKLKQILW